MTGVYSARPEEQRDQDFFRLWKVYTSLVHRRLQEAERLDQWAPRDTLKALAMNMLSRLRK